MPVIVIDMNDAELSALIHAAQSGSIGAFAEIVRCFQHDVRRAVTRHLGRVADVDDVAQDVFVQAWQNLGTCQSTGSLGAWLLGIARHRALDFLRREMVRRRRRDLLFEFAETDLLALEAETPPDDSEEERTMADLQACLDDLAPRQQSLIEQFYFEDVPAESIATELGRRPGTIRMMLLRIRTALRQCIERRDISRSAP